MVACLWGFMFNILKLGGVLFCIVPHASGLFLTSIRIFRNIVCTFYIMWQFSYPSSPPWISIWYIFHWYYATMLYLLWQMECQILRFTSYSANRKCVSYPLSDKIRTSFHLILSSKITCIFIKFFLLLWSENIRVYLKLRKKASTSKLICQFKTSRACTCSGYIQTI